MADKSFEQQVKDELSELRMKPGASVWPGVEAALHQERKRRWLIWLFLLAGCAGASFWGYFYFSQDKKEITHIPAQTQSIPKEEAKENTKEKDAQLLTAQPQSQQKTEPGVITPAVSTGTGKENVKHMAVSTAKSTLVKKQLNRDVLVEKEVQSRSTTDSKNTEKISDDPKPQAGTGTNNTTANNIVKDPRKDIGDAPAKKQAVVTGEDSARGLSKIDQKGVDTPPAVTATITENEPPVVPALVNTKKNKWQWNISVNAGSSGLREGLGFGFTKSADLASSTAPPSNNNGQSMGTGSEPAVKDAFSFGIQLQATKPLGKKHRLGLSAGYSLLQTSMNVGRKVDSAASWFNFAGANYSGFYYTTTDSTAYNNQFHFIRLGADLYTPFRLFKKIPFQWQLGVGVNILAATNGLHYDPVARKLFSNNALYAKAQAYISTGIDLAIGKNPFLYIGPHWQYSFTNLTSKPGGDQHLFLSSVKVSFVLPKKKK